jgi:TRAP-type C4-dicarboxylate transport system substrate-binding protein
MAHLPTWTALPDDLKELIERNAAKYVRQQRKEQGDLNQSLREDFSSRGLLFNDVDQGGVPRQTARCLCQVERKAR